MAVCPICKAKIQARIVKKDEKVYLQKMCNEHGMFEALISSDKEWYESSRGYIKKGQAPLKVNVKDFKGCPESCGFCDEHQQHTCLPVIEITNMCDLSCPICLKNLDSIKALYLQEFEEIIDNLFESEGKVPVINISGGEPTLHPKFREMVNKAYEKGVTQITVSTNGLNLLKDKNLRKFFKDTNTIAAVQFDGFKAGSYEYLRGENLLAKKLHLIKILEEEGLLFSLVSTIAKDINDDEVEKITDFFFNSKALSLMFQPASYTGSASSLPEKVNIRKKEPLTIPDIVKEIEKSEYVSKGDFNPLPCSHYSCFALSYYLKIEDGSFFSLKEFLGRENYLNVIANKTLPGLDVEGYSSIKDRIYKFWSASDSSNVNEKVLKRIKKLILEMGSGDFNSKKALLMGIDNMKAIFIHHFMDADNFDFGRLMKCCNPYALSDGRLVPMCAQNLFFQ